MAGDAKMVKEAIQQSPGSPDSLDSKSSKELYDQQITLRKLDNPKLPQGWKLCMPGELLYIDLASFKATPSSAFRVLFSVNSEFRRINLPVPTARQLNYVELSWQERMVVRLKLNPQSREYTDTELQPVLVESTRGCVTTYSGKPADSNAGLAPACEFGKNLFAATTSFYGKNDSFYHDPSLGTFSIRNHNDFANVAYSVGELNDYFAKKFFNKLIRIGLLTKEEAEFLYSHFDLKKMTDKEAYVRKWINKLLNKTIPDYENIYKMIIKYIERRINTSSTPNYLVDPYDFPVEVANLLHSKNQTVYAIQILRAIPKTSHFYSVAQNDLPALERARFEALLEFSAASHGASPASVEVPAPAESSAAAASAPSVFTPSFGVAQRGPQSGSLMPLSASAAQIETDQVHERKRKTPGSESTESTGVDNLGEKTTSPKKAKKD